MPKYGGPMGTKGRHPCDEIQWHPFSTALKKCNLSGFQVILKQAVNNMISKQKFWEQIDCAIDTFCIFPYGLWTWKHFLLIMALKVVCTAKVIKKVNPASQSI